MVATSATSTTLAGVLAFLAMRRYFIRPIMTQYATFSGRTSRKEFWLFSLWCFVFFLRHPLCRRGARYLQRRIRDRGVLGPVWAGDNAPAIGDVRASSSMT